MNSDKPSFLSQPVVKNIFMYRNGDAYYEGRRLVINEKRVSNFETFLKEVTGGVQAPFGAVRNIYTPRAGHRVSSLEHIQSGEQYVAAGREKFKKLDYSHIGAKKKHVLQNVSEQVKRVPQSRIIASARFLKPINEPCLIFLLVNGDVLNPAVRLLIPQRLLGQFERVLELITEKMGLRILGGVRSLYTLDGIIISDGKEIENGQFYVAAGREKFKKLPYGELIFTKPTSLRRFVGSKAASLPPIYKYRRQNGNVGRHQSKSMVGCSDAGDLKTSPPGPGNKGYVSEVPQARSIKLSQKKSGLTMSLGARENDDEELKADGNPNSERHEPLPADEADFLTGSSHMSSKHMHEMNENGMEENMTGNEGKKAADDPSPVADQEEEGEEPVGEGTTEDVAQSEEAVDGREEESGEPTVDPTPTEDGEEEESGDLAEDPTPTEDGEEEESGDLAEDPTPTEDGEEEESEEPAEDPAPEVNGEEEESEEPTEDSTPAAVEDGDTRTAEENTEDENSGETLEEEKQNGEQENGEPDE